MFPNQSKALQNNTSIIRDALWRPQTRNCSRYLYTDKASGRPFQELDDGIAATILVGTRGQRELFLYFCLTDLAKRQELGCVKMTHSTHP